MVGNRSYSLWRWVIYTPPPLYSPLPCHTWHRFDWASNIYPFLQYTPPKSSVIPNRQLWWHKSSALSNRRPQCPSLLFYSTDNLDGISRLFNQTDDHSLFPVFCFFKQTTSLLFYQTDDFYIPLPWLSTNSPEGLVYIYTNSQITCI